MRSGKPRMHQFLSEKARDRFSRHPYEILLIMLVSKHVMVRFFPTIFDSIWYIGFFIATFFLLIWAYALHNNNNAKRGLTMDFWRRIIAVTAFLTFLVYEDFYP